MNQCEKSEITAPLTSIYSLAIISGLIAAIRVVESRQGPFAILCIFVTAPFTVLIQVFAILGAPVIGPISLVGE
jgi:hypothetical protein